MAGELWLHNLAALPAAGVVLRYDGQDNMTAHSTSTGAQLWQLQVGSQNWGSQAATATLAMSQPQGGAGRGGGHGGGRGVGGLSTGRGSGGRPAMQPIILHLTAEEGVEWAAACLAQRQQPLTQDADGG